MFTLHIIIFGFEHIGKELLEEIKRIHPDWYVARIITQGVVFDGDGNTLFLTHRFIKFVEYEEGSSESVKELISRAEKL